MGVEGHSLYPYHKHEYFNPWQHKVTADSKDSTHHHSGKYSDKKESSPMTTSEEREFKEAVERVVRLLAARISKWEKDGACSAGVFWVIERKDLVEEAKNIVKELVKNPRLFHDEKELSPRIDIAAEWYLKRINEWQGYPKKDAKKDDKKKEGGPLCSWHCPPQHPYPYPYMGMGYQQPFWGPPPPPPAAKKDDKGKAGPPPPPPHCPYPYPPMYPPMGGMMGGMGMGMMGGMGMGMTPMGGMSQQQRVPSSYPTEHRERRHKCKHHRRKRTEEPPQVICVHSPPVIVPPAQEPHNETPQSPQPQFESTMENQNDPRLNVHFHCPEKQPRPQIASPVGYNCSCASGYSYHPDSRGRSESRCHHRHRHHRRSCSGSRRHRSSSRGRRSTSRSGSSHRSRSRPRSVDPMVEELDLSNFDIVAKRGHHHHRHHHHRGHHYE